MSEWVDCGSYKKRVLFDEKQLSKGNLIQRVVFKPGSVVKPHFHKKQREVFLVEKGNAVITVDKKKHNVKPGDVIVCDPGQVHGTVNKNKEPCEITVFKVNFSKDDVFWLD